MRKELIWVGIIGIAFGLIIGFGSWRVKSTIKPKSSSQPSPTPQVVGQYKISLDKPEEGDVLTDTPATVSGITKPLTFLTFSGEKGDYTIQSDESGFFSQDVELIAGINQIKVTLFDTKGSEVSQKVIVVYSSSFKQVGSASHTPSSATGSAEINQKVAQKVAEAKSKPKAYFGTVTDIIDSTIQIKTTDAQIEQVAIGEAGIVVVNTKGTNNKALKLTDIAIGDFIVAMGYINGNQVLHAQRILVTDPVTEPKISISMAKVTDVSKKSLNVISTKDSQKIIVTPDKNTNIISFLNKKTKDILLSDIIANDLVIIVTDNSGNTPLVRSIFDISQKVS
jgi:hypothetical protein